MNDHACGKPRKFACGWEMGDNESSWSGLTILIMSSMLFLGVLPGHCMMGPRKILIILTPI